MNLLNITPPTKLNNRSIVTRFSSDLNLSSKLEKNTVGTNLYLVTKSNNDSSPMNCKKTTYNKASKVRFEKVDKVEVAKKSSINGSFKIKQNLKKNTENFHERQINLPDETKEKTEKSTIKKDKKMKDELFTLDNNLKSSHENFGTYF